MTVSFLLLLQAWGLTYLQKRNSILDVFCDICEVSHNLNFTEDSWVTASDFQQHFRHVTCSINNINLVTAEFLSRTSTKGCSQWLKDTFFCGWGCCNEQKRVFRRYSHPDVYWKKRHSGMFGKTHRKTLVWESFFSW